VDQSLHITADAEFKSEFVDGRRLKFEDPHVFATKLNCKARDCKWTVYMQVFGLKL